MKSTRELYDDFASLMGNVVYTVSVPINKVLNSSKNFINNRNKKKEYIWEYDKQFGDCGCKAIDGALSEPYCQHYNKLIRKRGK